MQANVDQPTAGIRVLLSGSAADSLARTLAGAPALSVIRRDEGHAAPTNADVAVHVVESSSAPGLIAEIERLRRLEDAPVILAAYGEPNGIVETGFAVGAADVLVLPQSAETLLFAIRKAARATAERPTGRLVTVFSPKGGSGKTVVATNLAVSAARAGLRSLLIDLDLQFGDSALSLAVTPRATIADLAVSASEVNVERLRAFVSVEPRTRVAVLPAPQRPEDADLVGQAELAAVLEAARSAYDAVVVDTGPLFDGAMLAALDHTDRLLLICNPEVTSLKNVRIGLQTIERLGFDRERVSLVANRIGAAGAVSRADIETALETEVAFELPDDPAVPVAVNRALPVVVGDERSPFAKALVAMTPLVFDVTRSPETAPREQRRFLLRGRR